MKQTLSSVLAGIAVCMSITVTAQIKVHSFNANQYVAQNYSNVYIPSFSFNSGHSLNDIHLDAVRDFLERYKGEATEVTWQVNETGIIARFTVDSVDVTVAYGKHGNWLSSVKRYSENRLTTDVKSFVKKEYPGYSIAHVDEVDVPLQKNTTYYVTVQNNAEIKVLSICNNEMEVTQSFKKQGTE